ncbi:hypothetical protein OAQ84_01370, partial [Bdellovibrionales bacterium]|nr:hypothetical protein [Bdellovibrionales bacterium]
MKEKYYLYILVLITLSAISLNAVKANIVGSDFQLFNPIPSGIDFVTVHSAETLAPKHLNLGLYVNGATNALP